MPYCPDDTIMLITCFTSQQDMTSSSKTTSIRPFRCSICGRRSNWKCDIRKHYRQVHPGRHDARVELMTKEELLEAGKIGPMVKPWNTASQCGSFEIDIVV